MNGHMGLFGTLVVCAVIFVFGMTVGGLRILIVEQLPFSEGVNWAIAIAAFTLFIMLLTSVFRRISGPGKRAGSGMTEKGEPVKKFWKNGVWMMIFSVLFFVTFLIIVEDTGIKSWPFPRIVSSVIVMFFMVLPIAVFIVGISRYTAFNKRVAAKGKTAYEHPAAAEPAAGPKAEAAESGMKCGAEMEAFLKEEFGKKPEVSLPEEMLDDVSYIREMHHEQSGAWQQYDFLMAARGYGWNYMLSTADYMAKADLENIGTVTTAEMANMEETELIGSYKANGGKIPEITELAVERGQLAIGGMSKALNGYPVKIVWFNQTQLFRIFTIPDDDQLMLRYAESVIRRTFGTPDAMKLAKPVPADK